jgi:type II secretory pathway component PulF
LFEQRTERLTSRLVALAEPVMIITLGIVVGSVALSLLQAIYGVNSGSF